MQKLEVAEVLHIYFGLPDEKCPVKDSSLGLDQLPVVMRGPERLLCALTRITPGGCKKVGWPLILMVPTFQGPPNLPKANPYSN